MIGQKCPTGGTFGFACGPAPLVDHGTTTPGRWRFPVAFVPWKGREDAASAVCTSQNLQKWTYLIETQ